MLANVILTCTICGAQNVRERLHQNMLTKDGVISSCAVCRKDTLQKVSGNTDPVPVASRSSPSVDKTTQDDELWANFVRRLQDNNLTITDLFRCDEPTQMRLIGTIGFDSVQQQRLAELVREKSRQPAGPQRGPQQLGQSPLPAPKKSSPFAQQPPATAPPPSTMTSPMGSIMQQPSVPQSVQLRTQPGPPLSQFPQKSAPPLTKSSPQQNSPNPTPATFESPLRGIQMQGEQLIARCSVYPNQPAEFWCCACNALVSSRCHVQGIHKDHPFISLRLAAEAHLRDMIAWSERCRSQLNTTQSILANLRHAEELVAQEAAHQHQQLEEAAVQVYEDLMRWKEQLKSDMSSMLLAQQTSIQTSIRQVEQMHSLYQSMLSTCEPLCHHIPPADDIDRSGSDWALRVLDLVSRLRHVNAEPIPLPRIIVPRVVCAATPSTQMELLKCLNYPLGVRLPDIVDPGYFNFPHPSASSRVPFTIDIPDDYIARGIHVYNGRTLTRSPDVVPAHMLVTASQAFFSGITTWEVHVDRIGSGPGRILAGIIVQGTDGEGVVWDGQRIVGPNEGECRKIDERYVIRPGTVLRFHLELEPPTCFLNCFFDRDGVARVPLPPVNQGWVPAFSVFGPHDQITVVPTSATQHAMKDPTAATATKSIPATVFERQEHMISALQQQIQAVSTRLDQEQYKRVTQESLAQSERSKSPQVVQPQMRPVPPVSRTMPQMSVGMPPVLSSTTNLSRAAAPVAPLHQQPPSESDRQLPSSTLEFYSPELRQLMRYVDDVR